MERAPWADLDPPPTINRWGRLPSSSFTAFLAGFGALGGHLCSGGLGALAVLLEALHAHALSILGVGILASGLASLPCFLLHRRPLHLV